MRLALMAGFQPPGGSSEFHLRWHTKQPTTIQYSNTPEVIPNSFKSHPPHERTKVRTEKHLGFTLVPIAAGPT